MAVDNWHQLERWEQKAHVMAGIRITLDRIAREGREPDVWEAHDLLAAMGAAMGGLQTYALNLVARANEPPERRSGTWDRTDTTPKVEDLRRALEMVSGA